jgi:hypothetical protein
MERLPLCAATRQFLFRILCSGNVGTGDVRTTVTLVSELTTNFGEYYVITVLWDVT